jgi:hypothetical protein
MFHDTKDASTIYGLMMQECSAHGVVPDGSSGNTIDIIDAIRCSTADGFVLVLLFLFTICYYCDTTVSWHLNSDEIFERGTMNLVARFAATIMVGVVAIDHFHYYFDSTTAHVLSFVFPFLYCTIAHFHDSQTAIRYFGAKILDYYSVVVVVVVVVVKCIRGTFSWSHR